MTETCAFDRGTAFVVPFPEDSQMPNQNEIKGIEQVRGRVKQGVGDVTGDNRLKDEGVADEVAGEAQEGFGTAKRKIGDAVKDLGDRIKH